MHNYTLRPVLWEHKIDKNNKCPIVIALTINRKVTYFTTPYKIEKKYWNNESKETLPPFPNYKAINIDLRKRMADFEQIILKKSFEGIQVTGAILKAEQRGGNDKNFFKYVSDLKKDKDASQTPGSRINYNKEINRFMQFAGSHLPINSIDVALLRKYEAHERKRKMAQNTINTTFKWLRTVLTHASSEGVIKNNPFENFSIPKYVQSDRTFLEKHERDLWVKKWKEKKVQGPLYATLTYFLLGVFSGLRNSDWGRALSMVNGDILRLRPVKTHKSGQWVVLPIGPTLASIFEVVATMPPPISQRKTNDHLAIIAGIFECKQHITTHVARHSFATMCAENKIPKSVTAELMGVTFDTVEIYYHLTGENISEQAAVLRGI